MKNAAQKSSRMRVVTALLCAAFELACNDAAPIPVAPLVAISDRIPQQTTPKLGDDPLYGGVDSWPRFAQPLEDGDGRELTETVCSACHSTAYIVGQPPLEQADWKAEVQRMVDMYGATVPDGGAEKITAYLTAHYGPGRKADSAAMAAKFPRGQKIYETNCVACHQLAGTGIPNAFPPLAGHVPELLETDAGRAYLPQVVLYGLQGEITVNSTPFNNVMTPFPQLSDADIAEVLNHVSTAWGNAAALKNFTPFVSQDIAVARARGGASQKTRAARPQ